MLLKSFVSSAQTYNVTTYENSADVSLDIFPHHMTLEIWVEARNELGKIESEHLKEDAGTKSSAVFHSQIMTSVGRE